MADEHDVLDGERSAASLDASRRARLDAMEKAIARAVAPILAEPVPDLTDRVMERVESTPPMTTAPSRRIRLGSRVQKLWEPRTVTLHVRPLLVAAALAALIPIGIATARRASTPTAGPAAAAAAPSELYIQFKLDDPNARSVALAGSFTDWTPSYQLHETAPGVWSILVPLHPGVHQYSFVIDGERWVADPSAAQVADGFGGVNSQVSVLPPTNL